MLGFSPLSFNGAELSSKSSESRFGGIPHRAQPFKLSPKAKRQMVRMRKTVRTSGNDFTQLGLRLKSLFVKGNWIREVLNVRCEVS